MTAPLSSLLLRERRIQMLAIGGIAMALTLVALVAHTDRALFIDEGGAPKAFGAVALPPPAIGTLRRFGWVPREVLTRAFAPAVPRALPALRRRALGGSALPDQDDFAQAVDPAAALPMTASVAALTQPGEGFTRIGTPGVRLAGFGPGGGGGGGVASGGGGGGATPAPEVTPDAMPTPAPAPTPTPPTPTPAVTPVPEPAPSATPTLDPQPTPVAIPDPEPVPTTMPVPILPLDPIAAVPEPSSWVLLILGFGLVGVGLRRRAARSVAIAG